MKTIEIPAITIKTIINEAVEKVWKFWTEPIHIIHWNNASDDWHTTYAEIDLRAGGRFLSRMESKDGSTGFDFTGEYDKVDHFKKIKYIMDDSRKVKVLFKSKKDKTILTENFQAELTNSIELQKAGWQAILDNFKKYVEASGKLEVLHFEVNLSCNIDTVYKTLIDQGKYKEWTSVFNPSSHFKGTWEKGSKILFLGTDKDGKMGGMVSKIRENIPNKFISIEHTGVFKDGNEIISGPEVEDWSGSLENYSLKSADNKTILSIDIDSNQEFKSYLSETWPRALDKIRSICE